MPKIITYLTFNGNCREAMTFYKSCFGGELYLQTVGESPMAAELPEEMKNSILHSLLKNGDLMLSATDMVGDDGIKKGNSISLLLECMDEEEMRDLYEKLSDEGHQTFPIEPTFWGALFGGVTDKYGNQWLLNCSINNNL